MGKGIGLIWNSGKELSVYDTHKPKTFLLELHIVITLLPDQIPIPSTSQAFGPDGHLVDPKQEAKVKALGATLVENLK